MGDHDQRILIVLNEFPEGLGFNEIKEKTGMPAKTLKNHLDFLVDQKLISRDETRPGKKGYPVLYKIAINEDLRYLLQTTIKQAFDIQLDDTKKKIQH